MTDRRRREPASPGRRAATVGAIVARARVNAQLSQRELAKLAGVSNSTVAQLERGMDARWDTVLGIARVLPGFTAAAAIMPRSRHPPQASAAAVEAMRRLYDIGASTVRERLTLRPDGSAARLVEIEGVRLASKLSPRTTDSSACAALMRAACVGTPGFRRRLAVASPVEEGERTLMDGNVPHRFTLTHDDGWRLDYSCEGPVELDPERKSPALRHVVALPADELRLELSGAGEGAPRLRAWTSSSLVEPEASDLAERLHPGGMGLRLERRGELLVAVIAAPLEGVQYELAPSGDGHERRASSRAATSIEIAAETARRVREREGLSLREMAERVGVSFATVRQVEARRPARISTLQAYLRAFPTLAPQDLLPVAESMGSLTQHELWDYQRRVFGFWAQEFEKVLRVRSDGASQSTMTTRGMRAEVAPDSTLSLRLAFSNAVMADRPPSPLRKVSASSKNLRVSTFRHRDGDLLHRFTFPDGLLARGATYERQFSWKPSFRMHDETTDAEARAAFTSLTLPHPARVLRLILVLPAGYRTARFFAHGWIDAHVPHGEDLDLLDVLPKLRHDLRFDSSRNRLVLEVHEPFAGMRIAVGWEKPRRRRRSRESQLSVSHSSMMMPSATAN